MSLTCPELAEVDASAVLGVTDMGAAVGGQSWHQRGVEKHRQERKQRPGIPVAVAVAVAAVAGNAAELRPGLALGQKMEDAGLRKDAR